MFNRAAVIVTAALILCGSNALEGHAQKKASRRTAERQTEQKGGSQKPPVCSPAAAQPVTFYSGEATVVIKSDRHDPIRIGMAAGGVTIIEFPVSDKFFAIHPPGNGAWIEVEKSPSQKTDTHLVLRAGKDLIGAIGPAATLSAQMRSGLVLTFWIYPAKWISQQTNRLVVKYDPEAIIAERRAAGLAVNLGESEEREASKSSPGAAAPAKPPETFTAPAPVSPAVASQAQPAAPQPTAPEVIKSEQSEKALKALRGLLKAAAADPKGFKRWSESTNGLSVATQMRDLDDDTKAAVVAVRNDEDEEAIRLLAGHPELVIQTLDGKGKIVQLESVKQIHTESTTSNNIIPAKATVYFVVAFAPPTLGKQQRLTVTVGQKNAADDPAIAGLSTKKK